MKIVVIDMTADIARDIHSMELALATSKRTEGRAKLLLDVARASPEMLEIARGIYMRAMKRAKILQAGLNRLVVGEREAQ